MYGVKYFPFLGLSSNVVLLFGKDSFLNLTLEGAAYSEVPEVLQFIWKSGHCFLYSCSRCKNVVFVKPKLVVSPHLEVGLSKIRGHEPLLLVLGGNNQGCSCVGRSDASGPA